MTFNDFFVFQGKPGLFFTVEFAAIISLVVIYLLNRKRTEKIHTVRDEKIVSLVPGFLLIALIAGLAIGSFMPHFMDYVGGIICCGLALTGIIWSIFSNKIKTFHVIRDTDWETFFFLAAIFALIGSLTETGTTTLLAKTVGGLTSGNLLITYIVLVVFSVIISAFVDNVPYFAAMVGVITSLAQEYGYPSYLLLFGTIIGTTIGGNITPIGAAANIVAVGLLKKHGYDITFWRFMKYGLPFTIAAVTAGAVFIWIFWS
jgi:Na+/H+ antiporter NhaD/arsenite permease-like protein